MSLLKRYWNKVSAIGLAHAATEEEIVHTKLCNQFTIILALTSVEYVFVFHFLGYPYQGNLVLLVIVAYLTPLLFNYWGYLSFARFMAVFTVSAAITVFTSFFGTGSSIPHLCYALMAAPLLFYNLKNKKWLFPTMIVGILPIFLSRWFFQKPTLDIAPDTVIVLSILLKLTTITTLIIIIFRFARLVNSEQTKQQNLYTALQNADRYKSEFFANISHELRTPMNAIIGFTEILLNRNIPAEEKEYLQIIKTSGENLLRIINDLLDISKMESGKMTFEESPISIRELFSSLQNMMLPRAKDKNLSLAFKYPANTPGVVLGDPIRLTQIIINLVANALKFTENGGITVSVKVLQEEIGQFLIEFTVEDTGVGIPEDKLKYIFERFRQADSTTTRQYGGTGLGLSIVKQLVELQGGIISVKSKISAGSSFTVILPFKKYTLEAMNHKQIHKTDIDYEMLKRLDILLVEDNPINIKFVQTLFSEYGISADVAEDGVQAIQKLQNDDYDLILMDIEMPNMNGYETAQMIRNELKLNVYIIAMTANAMAGEREKCIAYGMNAYIPKPVSIQLLFEKINAISIAKFGMPDKAPQIETPQNTAPKKLINLAFLFENMGNKKTEIIEIIDIFCEQLPEDMKELFAAIDRIDYENIRQYAHRMKSTLSLMGVETMLTLSKKIEAKSMEGSGIEEINDMYTSLHAYYEEVLKEAREEKNKIMLSS